MSQDAPLIPPCEQTQRRGESRSSSRKEENGEDETSFLCFLCFHSCRPKSWYEQGSPARVRALKELLEEYAAVQRDVAKLDGHCRILYRRFFVHIRNGKDPELDYFKGALKWYKQNRDEMHETITEMLILFADAQENGEAFPIKWDRMPEQIRIKRRRWKQPFKPEHIAERHVAEAFTMPKHRRKDVPLDAETDIEMIN